MRAKCLRRGRVAVVTDSSAYLPRDLVVEHGLFVVPLRVSMGEINGVEADDQAGGVEALELAYGGSQRLITPTQAAEALRAHVVLRTSRPSPSVFSAIYVQLLQTHEQVVSIHLSSVLSGTVAAARAAASEFEGHVAVVDSRSTAMGLGFSVLAAAEAARLGEAAAIVAQRAEATQEATTALFVVDSLEQLRRGGRIGAAASLVGTALAVKPILHIRDGAISVREKVRTHARACARLEELAGLAAAQGRVELAIHHVAAQEQAGRLADRVSARVVALGGVVENVVVSQLGPAVSAHVGLGMLGVIVHRRGALDEVSSID